MRARCFDPSREDYKRYGAVGITVCQEWLDFNNFLNDMGLRPEGTSIDRIDNSKGYFKENCRWSTYTQQSENRTNARKYLFEGEMKSVAEISEITGLKRETIYARLNTYKWRTEFLASPPDKRRKKFRRSG